MQSGGTWLGVSDRGRFAVVTNLGGYGMPKPGRPSRGELVTDWLSNTGRYADPCEAELAHFNPFNLIVADGERAHFLSNRPDSVSSTMDAGIYGLSNGGLNEPWPRTTQLKAFLQDWLASETGRPETLLDDLREERLPDLDTRPARSSTDESPPSPIFIRHPLYGTRCSTVVAIDDQGRGQIIERRYTPAGEATGETAIPFSWAK